MLTSNTRAHTWVCICEHTQLLARGLEFLQMIYLFFFFFFFFPVSCPSHFAFPQQPRCHGFPVELWRPADRNHPGCGVSMHTLTHAHTYCGLRVHIWCMEGLQAQHVPQPGVPLHACSDPHTHWANMGAGARGIPAVLKSACTQLPVTSAMLRSE